MKIPFTFGVISSAMALLCQSIGFEGIAFIFAILGGSFLGSVMAGWLIEIGEGRR